MAIKHKLLRKLKNSFLQLFWTIEKLILAIVQQMAHLPVWCGQEIEKRLRNRTSPRGKNQKSGQHHSRYSLPITLKLPKRKPSELRKNAHYRANRDKNRLGSATRSPLNYLRFRKQLQSVLSPKGFVLPTMTMVLLVFSLVVGSILLRTSQYSRETISNRESQVIYNTATPAIERAKSKLEFLFKRDPRFPNTIPDAKLLERFVLNVDQAGEGYKNSSGVYEDIYTLHDEKRVDINKDGKDDNAWTYETDIDGDGSTELVAYSIIINNKIFDAQKNPIVTLNDSDQTKAKNLITRTGPLTIQSEDSIGKCANVALKPEEGWYPVNNASVRKNFQIDAVVVNKDVANQQLVTLEFQQDRQLDRGNKWGVWFRYDLEVFPGPEFNWNGAMYTGGNLMWGQNTDKFRPHLISSPNSCFYTEDASEIAMNQVEDANGSILFQGQMINSGIANNNFAGDSRVDIYPGPKEAPSTQTTPATKGLVLNRESDSVKDSLQGNNSPYDFSLDPIVLFTQDISRSRNTSSINDPSNVQTRDPGWANNIISKRIINKFVNKPYVDDAYRADSRWGPKPTYTSAISVPSPDKYGTDIDNFKDILIKDNPPPDLLEEVGLDGYWERRARVEGLRVIVGQRLELGNMYGWDQSKDPLYRPNTTLTNLDRQRRTLRDNLAAVQSTLVYHYQHDRDFPVATLATTVHNGTTKTRDNSRTFKTDGTTSLPTNIDFFTGQGTDGWEFNPPGNVTNEADFKALIDDASDPLRIALTNLAHFAGDPDGAFPPKQEAPGSTIIHPYPNLTMWGDYSNLRRVISLLDGGTNYDALSIADKTTLHTAASTVGLLASNLKNFYETSGMGGSDPNAGITALGNHMEDLVNGLYKNNSEGDDIYNVFPLDPLPANLQFLKDGNPLNGEINPLTGKIFPLTDITTLGNIYSQFTPEQYIQALSNDTSLGSNKDELITRAKTLIQELQIERDREFGFVSSAAGSNWDTWTAVFSSGNKIDFYNSLQLPSVNLTGSLGTLKLSCNPNIFLDVLKKQNSGTVPGGLEEKELGLALAFCPRETKPKYPALYYLFPKNNHNQIGTNVTATNPTATNLLTTDDQPIDNPATTTVTEGEEYINDRYIFNAATNPITGINKDYIYKIIRDSDSNGRETSAEFEAWLPQVALLPRKRDNWLLPSTTTDTGTGNRIMVNGSPIFTAFLDKAFFDGRQIMQIRAVDVDLNLLKTNIVKNQTDTWLTKSGIIYAFREDAVREDGIARPASSTWANCDTEGKIFSDTCRMNTNSLKDPPVSAVTRVSTKPVDFYADPSRRPYGFRLKNGQDLSRTQSNAGISFISDNPIYIQGNFNLHQNSSGTRLEEFTTLLADNWSNFYTRGGGGTTGTLDNDFAKPSVDRWRVAEILGDAVVILSNDFCDGVFEDGMKNTNLNSCLTGSGFSSYLNSLLAVNNATNNAYTWRRENQSDNTDSSNSPILIDRNAVIKRSNVVVGNDTFDDYRRLFDGRQVNVVTADTRVNAVIISGLVPSRAGQSYGGLHNFPRFLQNWENDNLHIAGAFFQLNFSTYATGPYDHQGWEPGETPGSGEQLQYYNPPIRRWGYDIALQYTPPSPIASRFINLGSPRNEFYEQRSADDPYIKQLRCAKTSTNRRVDPNLSDAQCT